jgi:hypothetical protein
MRRNVLWYTYGFDSKSIDFPNYVIPFWGIYTYRAKTALPNLLAETHWVRAQTSIFARILIKKSAEIFFILRSREKVTLDYSNIAKSRKTKLNSVALVRERTIPTERRS